MRPQLLSTRGFSTKTQEPKEKVIYSEEYLQRQQTDKKGKFFEFIQKIDKLDATPTPSAASQDYDISELDISFDKVSAKTSPADAAKPSGA